MKRVLVFIICIFLIIITTDYALGICSRYYIKNYQLTGRYLPLDRLLKTINTDIIMIGNSVVLNTFNPSTFEDKLSMTCYNGGIIGQGVDFSETIIDCILQRHTPKMVILGFRPEEMGANIGDGIFDILKPYYDMGYPSIDKHFKDRSKLDRLFLNSNLLRYNTIWVRVLLYNLFDDTHYSDNGFMPNDIPNKQPEIRVINILDKPETRKINSLEHIIKTCKFKGIKLYVCFPPALYDFAEDSLPCITAVKDLCKQSDIICFDDHNDSSFIHNPKLFYDNNHVTYEGAERYSKLLASRINNIEHQSKDNCHDNR